jgi:hypothetical protein
MLEEAEVVAGGYGDKVESRGRWADWKDERTWISTTESDRLSFGISSLKSHRTHENATTIIRAEDPMAEKDTGYPEDQHAIYMNVPKTQFSIRAGNSGCTRIWEFCNFADKLGSANTTA